MDHQKKICFGQSVPTLRSLASNRDHLLDSHLQSTRVAHKLFVQLPGFTLIPSQYTCVPHIGDRNVESGDETGCLTSTHISEVVDALVTWLSAEGQKFGDPRNAQTPPHVPINRSDRAKRAKLGLAFPTKSRAANCLSARSTVRP